MSKYSFSFPNAQTEAPLHIGLQPALFSYEATLETAMSLLRLFAKKEYVNFEEDGK